jgi:hypothetical protein
MENPASYGLEKQLNSRYLGSQTKCTLYKTHVRPIRTYGSESWPLTRKDENVLRITERRTLRRIMAQIRKMVYGDQGMTMNSINYIMSQIY